MASPQQLIYSVSTSRPFVGTGASGCVFVDILPGQISTTVKYLTGGTLEILQCSTGASLVGGGSQSFVSPNFISGSTQTPAMLAALVGTGYLMGTSEVLTFNGPTRFYLSASGTTTQVAIIKGLDAGV